MTINGNWSDFILDFMDLTESMLSPDLFRRWTAISMIGAAVERRVWIKTQFGSTFPNLYTLLVAPPGVGKFVIETARDLMTESVQPGSKLPSFHIAPDSMSKASMMDNLGKARATRLVEAGTITYHSLFIAAEEFSVFLPGYDLEFIGVLNSIFNNKVKHSESRRTGSVKELSIEYPQLNILAGVQPGWLGSVFPEEAWSTGLASRLIMVYSSETPIKDMFEGRGEPEGLREQIRGKLGQLGELYGQMKWEPAAADRINQWHLGGGQPVPTHSKLAHYVRRRTLHLLKLSMISAIARTGHLVLRLADIERGLAWLLEAETLMPDIFRAMIGKSDMQVIEELHFFITSVWAKDRTKPVNERVLWSFLSARVPSDKIEKIIMTAERANVIARKAGTEDWVPRPRHEHGME